MPCDLRKVWESHISAAPHLGRTEQRKTGPWMHALSSIRATTPRFREGNRKAIEALSRCG
jgi:hypothetical protein